MKQERKFPIKRVPALAAYMLAAASLVPAFTVGVHCLFSGIVFLVLGLMLDPKLDRRKGGDR